MNTRMIQTKNHRSLFALLVAGAMLATGCSKDEPFDFYAAHPDAVRFGVTIGQAPDTRANTEGDGTTFNPLDRIAISANGGTTYSTYELPATGDNWLPASGERYIKWTEQSLSFQAYYPVTDGTSYATFTLPTDQSTLDGLRSADYMTATTTAQSSVPSVALAFEHQMAKLTVKITRGDEAEGIELGNVEVYTQVVGIENGQIIVADKGVEFLMPYKQSGDTYTVILPPQQANPDAEFIAIYELNGGQAFGLTGIPQLEKGKAYTLNLQVGHDGVKLGTITVKDWTPQDMDPGTALYKDPTIWDGKYPASTEEAKAWMGPESEGVTDADGRKHVFTITAARQLAALHYLVYNSVEMANATSNTKYSYATYKLAADIDLNNHPWTPIGQKDSTNATMLMGIFDGQGHTIRGMNITGDYFLCGFFGHVAGVVKHLNVKGTVAPVLTSNAGNIYCGGIAGRVYNNTNTCIAYCSFEGTIVATFNKPVSAGGIAGLMGYSAPGKILSCYSVVTSMTLDGTGSHTKGGIAGQMMDDASVIKGCYWQALTGITDVYGTKYDNGTVEGNNSFADAAAANAAVGKMNAATQTGYDYQWQAGTNGSYPVLVKK